MWLGRGEDQIELTLLLFSHLFDTKKILFFPAATHRYGQPPADIIKELAPGLEFDEEGMPKMDGQMPGMPFPPGVGGEECSIM